MNLEKLTNVLIESGLPRNMAENLEMAHNRYIRSIVDNNPSLNRVKEFMEDYKDLHGEEVSNMAIANGAIMYFTKSKIKVDYAEKIQLRIAKDKTVIEALSLYQKSNVRPEYDELSVPEELFDL